MVITPFATAMPRTPGWIKFAYSLGKAGIFKRALVFRSSAAEVAATIFRGKPRRVAGILECAGRAKRQRRFPMCFTLPPHSISPVVRNRPIARRTACDNHENLLTCGCNLAGSDFQ